MIQWFQNFPPILAVALIAMAPIVELRGALPLGITVFKLTPWISYVVSVAGNIIPIILISFLLPRLENTLRRHIHMADRLLGWWYARIAEKFQGKYHKFGDLALVIFVAIPLPMTGGWTGIVAAHLFKIKKWHAISLVSLGIAISGLIMLVITQSIRGLF